MTKSIFAAIALAGSLMMGGQALAAEGHGGGVEPELQSWSFAGVFGKYDEHQLQRGFQIYREVCSSCHSAKYFKFRMLSEEGGPGYSEEQVKALAAEYTVVDPETVEGERSAVAADAWPSPFLTEQDARDANGVWSPQATLAASNAGMGDAFGGSVAISHGVIAVGARGCGAGVLSVSSRPRGRRCVRRPG